ncbi:aminodeoxychorismate lyase [Arenimonas maotaiensis]|uniref:Endolytic murein transglycosylase n=1 Tax=Arenimonas maotaiensis TaxID=1446479 RepID=A0A917CM48_9GAMM|nr:endolytic transglycosylase MltG [Arenimonas maotaiensis]GGF92438.1 aminodeoxychorismate lyase [Arenimonas maotaiensis]
MAKSSSWRTRFLLLAMLAALAGLLAYLHLADFADRPLSVSPAPAALTVAPGDGLNKVLPKLRAAGIRGGMDWQWQLLARRMGMAGRIHVGDYEIADGSTPAAILRKLASGDTVRIRYTLVEGRAFRQVRAELAGIPGLQNDLADKRDDEIMALLGRAGVHPEGRFLPDTYFVPKSGNASDLLRQAAAAMDAALAEAWQQRDPAAPLKSPDELLILASIVEKETGAAHERPQIAGVFARRLRLGMRLQTDPSVIYGIGERYDGDIRTRDLRTDTPYNTYTRAGLPPTPIAMPGRAALQAAARPAPGDTLYFVATGNGEHVFSATYAEHKKAVATYQLKR